jgi:predicted TPR repeat methyltransferase
MSDFDARASTWDSDPAKLDRARKVAAAIESSDPDPRLRSVLNFGAGTGLLGFELWPRAAKVTLADTSVGMLAVAREKIARSSATNVQAIRLDLALEPPPPMTPSGGRSEPGAVGTIIDV